MSTVSADECYSNIDSIEDLRHICCERDSTIAKLKLLLVRKNKTISSLEQEICSLKAACQTADEHPIETAVEVINFQDLLGPQQAELERCKKEVETLSKMNNDLQRSITLLKDERELAKSEASRLVNDLVEANARTTELYLIASKSSSLANISYISAPDQHSFILSTFKSLLEDTSKSKPNLETLRVLHGIQREMDRLLGIEGATGDTLTLNSSEEVYLLLERFYSSLRECTSLSPLKQSLHTRSAEISSFLDAISRDNDEMRSALKHFKTFFTFTTQSLLSTVDRLSLVLSHRVNNASLRTEFSDIKTNLRCLREAFLFQKSLFVDDTTALKNKITCYLDSTSLSNRCHSVPVTEEAIPNGSKLKTILPAMPLLQSDMTAVKTSACYWFTSLRDQLDEIQRLHSKLLSEVERRPPPPPYSDYMDPPNSSVLEALLTDVWQLKDSLSGVKYFLVEETSSLQKGMKDIEKLRRILICNLNKKVTQLRDDATEIRTQMHQLISSFNYHLATFSNLSNWIEKVQVKSAEDGQRQRFKDYDRLVRDKEREIDQLRESCDRLTDESDRFCAIREALRQLVVPSPPGSLSLNTLTSEDAGLIRDLNERINQSQATRLELVEQTQAIASLQSDLGAKTAALDSAVARATKAEVNAAETAEEVLLLKEKLSRAKQLLVRARKDVADAEKRAECVVEMEKRIAELVQALADSEHHRKTAETKLTEVMGERERLSAKNALLQKQFESYKVKALHALRNGKDHLEENGGANGNSLGGIEGGAAGASLSWHYERSSLAETESARLRETVRELEASLTQTTARLNSASVDLEAVNFALAEEKEKCDRMSKSLQSERIRWQEEREELMSRWQNEVAARVCELETALEKAKQENSQELAAQADELNTAFGTKIAELKVQLEASEAKVEAQRLELIEQTKIAESIARASTSQTSTQDPICSHCRQHVSNTSGGANAVMSNRAHWPRPPEEALFGTEAMASTDRQEAERQTSQLQETIRALEAQLATEHRNMAYTRSLLADSESAVERLSAQAAVLKAEIRRLERNAERECQLGGNGTAEGQDAGENRVTRTEYLKNVLLRFLCVNVPQYGSNGGGGGIDAAAERSALVPVLTTLLALSPLERTALQQVAESGVLQASALTDGGGGVGNEEASSWTSLLPSWLGR